MRFSAGMLGACIVCLSLMGTIGMGFISGITTAEEQETGYEEITDVTSLYSYSKIYDYVEYNPVKNWTGWQGIDFETTTNVNQYVYSPQSTETSTETLTLSSDTVWSFDRRTQVQGSVDYLYLDYGRLTFKPTAGSSYVTFETPQSDDHDIHLGTLSDLVTLSRSYDQTLTMTYPGSPIVVPSSYLKTSSETVHDSTDRSATTTTYYFISQSSSKTETGVVFASTLTYNYKTQYVTAFDADGGQLWSARSDAVTALWGGWDGSKAVGNTIVESHMVQVPSVYMDVSAGVGLAGNGSQMIPGYDVTGMDSFTILCKFDSLAPLSANGMAYSMDFECESGFKFSFNIYSNINSISTLSIWWTDTDGLAGGDGQTVNYPISHPGIEGFALKFTGSGLIVSELETLDTSTSVYSLGSVIIQHDFGKDVGKVTSAAKTHQYEGWELSEYVAGGSLATWSNGMVNGAVSLLVVPADAPVYVVVGSSSCSLVRNASGSIVMSVGGVVRDIGTWPAVLVTINASDRTVTAEPVSSIINFQNFTLNDFKITVQDADLSGDSFADLKVFGSRDARFGVVRTLVFEDSYHILMENPSLDISAYYPSMVASGLRLTIEDVAKYGKTITVNGVEMDVSETGMVSVPSGSGIRNYPMDGMSITFSDGVCTMSFRSGHSSVDVDMGEISTYRISMTGSWYLTTTVSQPYSYTVTHYTLNPGEWDDEIGANAMLIIFIGLSILLGAILQNYRGLSALDIVVLVASDVIAVILLGAF